MFGPSSYHPHGAPPQHNGPYPAHSLGMGEREALFDPSALPTHGRGGFRHPFHGGPYEGFSPSGPLPPVRPPPRPGSSPLEAPPQSPLIEENFRFLRMPTLPPPPPPPMPKDPEMLKNIEVLSSFVVKNGPQFENMARAKQAGDPKFAFLFGGDRGTDAALGCDFYNWKKDQLVWVEERTRFSPAKHQNASKPVLHGRCGGPGAAGLSHESLGSPAGSDMDMEDDFALPDPNGDKKPGVDNSPAVPPVAVERKPGPTSIERKPSSPSIVSSPARDWKPELSSPLSSPLIDRRPGLSLFSASGGKSVHLPHGPFKLKAGTLLNVPVDQDSSQKGANRGLLQFLVPEPQGLGDSTALEDQNPRVSGVSMLQRENTSLDVPKRKDNRQRTAFDRPFMEDVSVECSSGRAEQQKGSLPGLDPDHKGASGNRHWKVPAKPSRWGRDASSLHLGSGVSFYDEMVATDVAKPVGKANKKLDTFAQKRRENSSTKDRFRSSDISTKPSQVHDVGNAKVNEKLKPKSELDQPAVDEFGRLLRQGASDSDTDDNHYAGHKKRRRTLSRSRSGSPSPGNMRFKHSSPGHSPHRRGRRTQSWSRSPRRNRVHTVLQDGRWGESGRGVHSALEKGSQREGRGAGVLPPTCFAFVKGKCFRGSSCRFFHEESHGTISDQSGRWSDGLGRVQEQGHTGRAGEEGDRDWNGKSRDSVKLRIHWETDGRASEDDSRELKLIAELKKQEDELSSDESLKQEKRITDNPVMSSEEPGQTETYQLVKSSSELTLKAFTPSRAVPSLLSQSSISLRLASQAGQQPTLLPQEQSVFCSSSTCATHKLGSLANPLSVQPSLTVSPTPHSQQLLSSPVVSPSQQPAFSMAVQLQKSCSHSSPVLSQNNGFASSTSHQQPAFTSAQDLFSGSPPLPNLKPLFPPVPLGQSHTIFNATQQPSFAPFCVSRGPSGLQFRLPVGGTQPQVLPSSLVQNLHQWPGHAWIQGGPGAPLSYLLGPPQHLQQPPPQAPSPLVSAAPITLYSCSLPISYAIPSYSSLSSKTVASEQPLTTHDQYDPLADSLEPAPPGSVEKNGLSNIERSLQVDLVNPSGVEKWRRNPGCTSVPLMTNAGEVVLENVSPGLPGHVDNGDIGSGIKGPVSPTPQAQVVMESMNPTDMCTILNGKALMKLGGSQHQVLMENVSPPDHNLTEAEGYKESAHKTQEETTKDKGGRFLKLIQKAVVEHVKDLLKPTWKGGQMSKEAFKTIAKKSVDKVMGAFEGNRQIPKTQEKVDIFMKTSKPKIAKLVQGYVDKYMKV